ncbi:MAG: magnesium transporter CorA family protein [Spirochaetaceae bacterium]|jgi:magnesium transporter|nr:magnesium transporter CorA family protein [Spirochaetaceae bacterium]
MITLWQQNGKKLARCEKNELDSASNTWIDARSINREDFRVLEEEYGIQAEHITDILDPDELSRIEKEDEYILVIVRVPLYTPADDVSYCTIPLGIIIFEKAVVTICWTDCDLLRDIAVTRLSLNDLPAFVVKVLSRADVTFLRYLKEINRTSTAIQNELQRSIRNNELIKLLNLEKSLVFFTTSLKSNQLLLEKMAKTRFLKFDEDDREWLEDVEIDNRQAIEMADTYSDIMSGMMDAFASVISNNLNIVMKRLTIVSLVLMVPTFIVSFFGMNIQLPLTEAGGLGVVVVGGLCVVLSLGAYLLILRGEKTPDEKPKNPPVLRSKKAPGEEPQKK